MRAVPLRGYPTVNGPEAKVISVVAYAYGRSTVRLGLPFRTVAE